MCRFLAYLGTQAARLDHLLLEPPHSLVVQSYRPREMEGAILNADGFGVAWYGDEEPAPALYRSAAPIWSDDNLPRIAPHVRSRCVLACVRSATPGLDVSIANTPPFVHGRLAFVHNGLLEDFRGRLARPVRESLSDAAYKAIGGTTDSEHVFAHVVDRLQGRSLRDALAETVIALCDLAASLGSRALLTVLVTDGTQVVATRHALGGRAPSLYLLARGAEAGTLVASEPTFAGDWIAVGEDRVVEIDPAGSVRESAL